jgi:hypothetical protein
MQRFFISEIKVMHSQFVYCPKCKRRVARYDGKSKINIIVECRKCRRLVLFHVDTGITENKRVPKRNTSSGTTIW